MRRAAKVDANQAQIVRELRDRGAVVWLIGQPVDLLVGYRGVLSLVEVKASQRANIRPSQRVCLDQCSTLKLPCYLIYDLDQVEEFYPIKVPHCAPADPAHHAAQFAAPSL